jgi:hypothetical protein
MVKNQNTVDFVFDSLPKARKFVEELPSDIRASRFASDLLTGKEATWKPNRCVLVLVDNRVVALADCIISDDNKSANGSLVALPSYGAHALLGLLKLKKVVGIPHWQSTLNNPTAATIAISTRYFDATYDGAAWDIHQEIIKKFGREVKIGPMPILVSRTNLKLFDLPRVETFSNDSCQQILFASNNIQEVSLWTRKGKELDAGTVFALTNEVAGIPMRTRQEVTRMFLLMAASMYKFKIEQKTVDLLINQETISKFTSMIRSKAPIKKPNEGLFVLRKRKQTSETVF